MIAIEPWNVAVKHTFEKEADSILIHPIGDVHYGAMSHMSDAWQKFVDKIIKEKSYLIILGDMINNNLISSVGSPYDDLQSALAEGKYVADASTDCRPHLIRCEREPRK